MPTIEAPTINLLGELRSARAEGDRLFEIIKQTALYERPIDARHRIVFYIGHLDGFDSIQICREGLGIASRDGEFDELFQAGIDPDSAHLPSDKPADWPSLDQISGYVSRCREHVDAHLDNAPEDVVHMALEHRLMHLETLAYMFHNVPYGMKEAPFADGSSGKCEIVNENKWREIPAGDAVLGKPNDGLFGWDNEYEEVHRSVPPFRMQRFSVSNGEYLKFVSNGAPIPHFWVNRGGAFYYRGMFSEFPLPLDWPVYVTHAEAEHYAQWLGKSLPSEEQFHRAAFGTPYGEQRAFPWGDAAPAAEHGNFNFRRWDPDSVFANALGDSAFGVSQMIGNGWQWTNTRFGPFPGFKPRVSYPGYSANFFDGKHYVMKGGSARTACRLLRRSFRNWFRNDYPYMYAAFRCVEN